MSRRTALFILLALLAAALFVRLGVWQLSRLAERRARNALIAERLRSEPVDVAALPRDTALARLRLVRVTGRWDYDREVAWAGRTRDGSPGVELLTPVRHAGSDTLLVVNRGWVYSPDAATVELTRWREGDSARVTGYVEEYAPDGEPGGGEGAGRRIVRQPRAAELARRMGAPVAPYYIVALGDTGDPSHPARRRRPELDDGPHRAYAVQWFAFAAIALGGAAAVVRRRSPRPG